MSLLKNIVITVLTKLSILDSEDEDTIRSYCYLYHVMVVYDMNDGRQCQWKLAGIFTEGFAQDR